MDSLSCYQFSLPLFLSLLLPICIAGRKECRDSVQRRRPGQVCVNHGQVFLHQPGRGLPHHQQDLRSGGYLPELSRQIRQDDKVSVLYTLCCLTEENERSWIELATFLLANEASLFSRLNVGTAYVNYILSLIYSIVIVQGHFGCEWHKLNGRQIAKLFFEKSNRELAAPLFQRDKGWWP